MAVRQTKRSASIKTLFTCVAGERIVIYIIMTEKAENIIIEVKISAFDLSYRDSNIVIF